MKHLLRGMLRNQLGEGGDAPAAAPAPVPDAQMSFDDLLSQAPDPAAVPADEPPQLQPLQQAEPEQQQPAEPEPGAPKSWAEALATLPKPTSAAERVARRDVSQLAEQHVQQTQMQMQQLQQQYIALQQRQDLARQEFRKALEAGDADKALQALGAEETFADLQKAVLAKKGIGGDPKVSKLEKELQALRAEREAENKAREERQQQEQQQYEQQQRVAAAKEALAQLPFEDAEALSGVYGFAESVVQQIEANPDLNFTQAAAIVQQNYAALAQDLLKASRALGLQAPPQEPQNQLRRPPTSLPRLNGATQKVDLPANPDERFELLLRESAKLAQ